MILTGKEIIKEVKAGNIIISPFHEDSINPNSYNYRIQPTLKIPTETLLDAKCPCTWQKLQIPDDGFLLEPGTLYLGATVEVLGSRKYVTSLIGRSSMGRLGMYLQLSADLSNLGSAHCWTLEISVVQPLRIYPLMKIGQVSFWIPHGSIDQYKGTFANHNDPTPYSTNTTRG